MIALSHVIFQKTNSVLPPDRINNYLIHLNHWLIANKIKMNSSKTKYIIYSYKNNVTFDRPICIGNEIIYQADSIKFLGVQLDENLLFKNHVDNI